MGPARRSDSLAVPTRRASHPRATGKVRAGRGAHLAPNASAGCHLPGHRIRRAFLEARLPVAKPRPPGSARSRPPASSDRRWRSGTLGPGRPEESLPRGSHRSGQARKHIRFVTSRNARVPHTIRSSRGDTPMRHGVLGVVPTLRPRRDPAPPSPHGARRTVPPLRNGCGALRLLGNGETGGPDPFSCMRFATDRTGTGKRYSR